MIMAIDEQAVAEARQVQASIWQAQGLRKRPNYYNTRVPENEGRKLLAWELRRRLK